MNVTEFKTKVMMRRMAETVTKVPIVSNKAAQSSIIIRLYVLMICKQSEIAQALILMMEKMTQLL